MAMMLGENAYMGLCRKVGGVLLSSVIGAALLNAVDPYSAAAAEKKCECEFSEQPWAAYGTAAACTAYSRAGRTSCEIQFGGLGADPKLIPQVLGTDSTKYFDEVYGTLAEYLEGLRKHDVQFLTRTEFLERAIPMLLRGAFIRDANDEAAISDMRMLDRAIGAFMKQYADDVGKAFRGERETFSYKDEENRTDFTVGQGTIIVDFKGAKLVATFLPGD